jgi:glycosyltransferase involved in cell wall biosynthesis
MGDKQRVTVLMAVYNGSRFLHDAINSILCQSYRDFEFLIVDDASEDDTASIIDSYQDERIKVLRNQSNIGLTRSLNRGIDFAKGDYIARMDADDIALLNRLSLQVEYLDSHPSCAVVAGKVLFIDGNGKGKGYWNDDQVTTSAEEICRYLPKANCIAHPSVMIRRSVLDQYRYDERHPVAQDYDLWLRLCRDGYRIEKIPEVLLKYRINPLSITEKGRRGSSELKNIKTKSLFLLDRVWESAFNPFCWKVFLGIFRELYYLIAKAAIRSLERTLANAGRYVGSCLPFTNGSGLFFFFPFCHVGGAERVHADIVNCFAAERPLIFFTKWSPKEDALRRDFAQAGPTFYWWLLLKYTYPFSAGVMAGIVNRHPQAVVFGCNTLFFYKMLPFLAPHVMKVDLLHAFGGGAEEFSLPAVHLLDARVVISPPAREDIAGQYVANGIDGEFLERVILIENQVQVPQTPPAKRVETPFSVIFVGRGTEEKRVHLVGRVATLCRERGLPVEFTLVGDVTEAVAMADRPNCRFTGEIVDAAEMGRIYGEADMLVVTSSREGFPLVVMEAMAHGVVPLCTSVGGIPYHIKHRENGWLVDNITGEQVVNDLVAGIEALCLDHEMRSCLSRSAHAYAAAHFAPGSFCQAYRNILLGEGTKRAPCRG